MKKEVLVSLPLYDKFKGFEFYWEDDFKIFVEKDNMHVRLIANKAGLLSLANHLLNLSQDEYDSGYHIHLDQFNSLEDGSTELIIEKL
ncbi:MAG: hypothetical protein RO257_01875 [Candidatus Kapabacteria bacterium]|jgi:hypothetical protein|nr:hypothetical protein [Candidatus Kapabacteria bacterium]